MFYILQDADLLIRFVPELLSLMAENILRGLYRQLNEEFLPYTPSQNFVKYLTNHTSAMHITCMYAMHLLEKKELKSFISILPIIAQAYTSSTEGTQMPYVFLHILVHHVTCQQELKVATLQVMLREFWMPCCQVFWLFFQAIHIAIIKPMYVIVIIKPNPFTLRLVKQFYFTCVDCCGKYTQN